MSLKSFSKSESTMPTFIGTWMSSSGASISCLTSLAARVCAGAAVLWMAAIPAGLQLGYEIEAAQKKQDELVEYQKQLESGAGFPGEARSASTRSQANEPGNGGGGSRSDRDC